MLVLGGKLVETENRDDILKILVALEHILHAAGDGVVLFPNNSRIERIGDRREGVHRRVDTQLGDRTLENNGRIQVSESVSRRRVGQVIGRDVNRLEGSNRTLLGGGNTLLKVTHFLGQRGLIAHRRRRATEKRGHLGTSLGKTENVVYEKEHVLVLFVAEVLRHSQSGQRDAHTSTGGLIHLTVNKGHFGVGDIFLINNACVRHLVVKIVTLTRALTDTSEYGVTPVRLGDIIDQFHDDDGLSNTGTPEGADFTTLGERANQVDHLDAGLENLGFGRLVDQLGRLAVDWTAFVGSDGAFFVHRVASNVEDTTENSFTDRDGDGRTRAHHFHATD